MSKSKKFILRAIPVLLLVVVLIASPVLADQSDVGISSDLPSSGGDSVTTVDNMATQIWGTVTTIAQIAAFAAIIFAGIRYMFASADTKADIKKQLVIIVVGALLVFGASTIVKILMNILNDVSGGV